jgi:ferredoxin
MVPWRNKTRLHYERMRKRHKWLWEFVHAFIKEHDIKSVFEVGCGIDPVVRKWADTYFGVDLNENAHDCIHADFTTMDVVPYQYVDLVLACGVIEHCEDCRVFFSQIKRIAPKFAVVSFFGATDRTEDIRTIQKGGYPFHGYTREGIEQTLNDLDMSHELLRIHFDDVLIITGE